ncbi:MAG TPA: hypothetical protein VHM16_02060 [Rubrobacteraceae bacterium]|nr:hypothetical protein [Rubrobacteraceae bacterium]
MNYGEIISSAVRLTWRNKFLWFFGFFAGASASFNFPGGGGSGDGGIGGGLPAPLRSIVSWVQDNLALFLTVVITLGVLIVVVGIVLSMISQGALAESVAALDRGEERRFGTTWRAGTANFWRVLGLKLLFILISIGVSLILTLVLVAPTVGIFFATESVAARVIAVIFAVLAGIALLVLIFIPLAVIGQWALRRLVVDRDRIWESIRSGFGLFRRNIGRSLLVWLIQLGLMLGAGIVMLIALIILGLLLVGPAFLLIRADYTALAITVGAIGGTILLAVFFVLSAILGTFNSSYWTLAYLRLSAPQHRDTETHQH